MQSQYERIQQQDLDSSHIENQTLFSSTTCITTHPASHDSPHGRPTTTNHDDDFMGDIDEAFADDDNEQLLSTTTRTSPSNALHTVHLQTPSSAQSPSSSSPMPPSYDKEAPPPEYIDYTLPPPYASPTDQVATAAFLYDGAMVDDDNEILIDGLPIGHPFLLVVNLMVSLSFDFIGFMLTYMLSTSHAARAGSRLGFGLTLLRYSLYIRYAEEDQDMLAYRHYATNMSPAELKAQSRYMSYLLMILGLVVILFANVDYYRVNKIRHTILRSANDAAQMA